MKLIVQPDDGVKPLIEAINRAKRTVTIVVFRFGLAELENALQAASKRGVAVHALVAHTTGKGEKRLRKLESRLLELVFAGAPIAVPASVLRWARRLPRRRHGRLGRAPRAAADIEQCPRPYQMQSRTRSPQEK